MITATFKDYCPHDPTNCAGYSTIWGYCGCVVALLCLLFPSTAAFGTLTLYNLESCCRDKAVSGECLSCSEPEYNEVYQGDCSELHCTSASLAGALGWPEISTGSQGKEPAWTSLVMGIAAIQVEKQTERLCFCSRHTELWNAFQAEYSFCKSFHRASV